MLTFIIADDHKIFRTGLKMALTEIEPQFNCIGEANNGMDLIELLKTNEPDVILMDLKMPGMDGIEAIKIIRFQNNTVKVLVLSMFNEENYIMEMIKSGANGYLLKNAEPTEIVSAMKMVREKPFFFNDLVSQTLFQKVILPDNGAEKKVSFNPKEIEILKLICEEHTTAEIAQKVFLSARTVEGIRSALLEKTGVRNTVGLVKYALKYKIVE